MTMNGQVNNTQAASKRERVRLRPAANISTTITTVNNNSLLSSSSSSTPLLSHSHAAYGWICWTLFVVIATLVLSNAVYFAPLLMLSRRKRRALESARVMDRVHYDDFVSYVRMVDFCGSACYRTKAEALRACWDKMRFCRVHFCRFEYEFGRMCKPIPGAWLPASPKPSVTPPTALSRASSKLGVKQISVADRANLPEAADRCQFKESMRTVGRAMVFRVQCQCRQHGGGSSSSGSIAAQQQQAFVITNFNASADSDVGTCVYAKFHAMAGSLETACKAQRNDSYQVYDWAFDTACSMCSGYRPRPTRCNLNA